MEKGGKHTLNHDLNFAKAKYENKHTISFKNPSAALLEVLKKSGSVPGEDSNGARKKGGDDKKRKRPQVDMDKLAEGLVKLSEDELLQVVQIIHDNKTDDTYTKNDVERKLCAPGNDGPLTIHRGRVSRRPLYTARPLHQNAMGFCSEAIIEWTVWDQSFQKTPGAV